MEGIERCLMQLVALQNEWKEVASSPVVFDHDEFLSRLRKQVHELGTLVTDFTGFWIDAHLVGSEMLEKLRTEMERPQA